LPEQHGTHVLADAFVPPTPENPMALPSSLKPASTIVTDPTAQKLADLEARIAKLEGALIIGAYGVITLKSSSNIVIESFSCVTIKASSTMTLQASSTMTLKGSTIDLN
jgi:hypothetical protein